MSSRSSIFSFRTLRSVPSASVPLLTVVLLAGLMLLAGRYHPAMTQLFYRIGDSTTNCFTPVMPYLWVTLKASQDMFDPKLKIGTFVSNLFPIGMILLVMWVIFLVVWMSLWLPIGPGVTTLVNI